MRYLACPLLALALLCVGCGGGGGEGDDPEEVVLAIWPFVEDSESSEPFDRVTIGFTGERAPFTLGDPVLLAIDVLDGQEGLQERVDAAAGGAPFGDQVTRLTDGVDSVLMVTMENGNGSSGGRRLLESDGLQALVFAQPDLEGTRITAFQVDLVRTVIEQGPIVPTEKSGAVSPAITIGTIVQLEGEVRILGIAASTD